MHPRTDYKKYRRSVSYLESLFRPFKAVRRPEIYLERTERLLDLLGNPEKNFSIIHITGTAGKGSVSRLVQSALAVDGRTVGLFTSPYVTSVIEEIQVSDLYIAPSEFASLVDRVKPAIKKMRREKNGPPSYFETIFALTLLYFHKKRCDFVVLEVGLGGRYDATNVVKHPVVTAITNIGYDHTEILGTTLEKIAGDKAGIVKQGSAFFTTEHRQSLLDIFRATSTKIGATFHAIRPRAAGDFQKNNIALAVAICRHLKVRNSSFQKAKRNFRLPARFETILINPRIILDGAHNPLKVRAAVEKLKHLHFKRLFLVVAFSEGKDVETMLRLLLPHASKIFITTYSAVHRHSMHTEEVAKICAKIGGQSLYERMENPLKAYEKARASLQRGDVLLVIGSFYLAGAIRTLFYPEERILQSRQSF